MKKTWTTVTSKGQVVIPAPVRRRLGIRKGTRLSVREEKGLLVLKPLTRDFIRSLQGCLESKPSALEILLAERKRERAL